MEKYSDFDLDIQNTKVEVNDAIVAGNGDTKIMCDYSVNKACSEAHICFWSLDEDK